MTSVMAALAVAIYNNTIVRLRMKATGNMRSLLVVKMANACWIMKSIRVRLDATQEKPEKVKDTINDTKSVAMSVAPTQSMLRSF